MAGWEHHVAPGGGEIWAIKSQASQVNPQEPLTFNMTVTTVIGHRRTGGAYFHLCKNNRRTTNPPIPCACSCYSTYTTSKH